MKAIYVEPGVSFDKCERCCLSPVCTCEGYCKCDQWREENAPDVEGDFYFVDDTGTLGDLKASIRCSE